MGQKQKQLAKNNFKTLVDKITNKKNWKTRFTKIKTFIQQNQRALSQQLSGQGGHNLEEYINNGKNQMFNLILALYAGENEEMIFKDLDLLYEKYPADLEFYIPQLCTYLFHFSNRDDNQNGNQVASDDLKAISEEIESQSENQN